MQYIKDHIGWIIALLVYLVAIGLITRNAYKSAPDETETDYPQIDDLY
jgi:hypothetical protein